MVCVFGKKDSYRRWADNGNCDKQFQGLIQAYKVKLHKQKVMNWEQGRYNITIMDGYFNWGQRGGRDRETMTIMKMPGILNMYTMCVNGIDSLIYHLGMLADSTYEKKCKQGFYESSTGAC
ncbi:hypothetical protein C5167_013533 [Papaver somniferum]|uniref:Uncharacterized protein n=1 Tax=Papaver somniferum TaxID=3469 RepID=A0A4Y7J2L0_PAPSO|nr:hypothetical protein C5167_013533 [Papaver somniferum]